MASAREMRLRIRSVKNISQVTRALQAVSASKVRKAIIALMATRPYATKAWQVMKHVAGQPGRQTLHPLLTERTEIKNTLVVVISGDRGLAGAYNVNIVRQTLQQYPRLRATRLFQMIPLWEVYEGQMMTGLRRIGKTLVPTRSEPD
jgi:F-type H+-transporting ATPase subunit gamma